MPTLKAVVLILAIASFQYFFDLKKLERPLMPPAIIPAQALKLGDLGLHSATSAMMWIYTIQKLETSSQELPKLIKNINNIDPKFSYPYAFTALVLPQFGFIEQAIEIAKKGIAEADPDWRIPYYLATTYHIFLKDRKNASLYFDIAANTPGAPENIVSISARYGTTKDMLEQTKQIWISLYETSGDELVIERAKNYIIHIEIIQALEKASLLYKQKYGFWPKTMEDLVTGRILKEIPKSPLGVGFRIELDGKISVQ
jgi:tetratricopeptide (TPR) repeat protein